MKSIHTILRLLLCLIALSTDVFSQGVGIGTTSPDSSSVLHLVSSNKGFLVPRLFTNEINAIAKPAEGLLVYNITDQCFWVKKPWHWNRICGGDTGYFSAVYTQLLNANYITTDTLNAQKIVTQTIIDQLLNANYITTDTLNAKVILNQTINTQNITSQNITSQTLNTQNITSQNITSQTLNTQNITSQNITSQTITSQKVITDSIYINGKSIKQLMIDSVKKNAWLLNGNTGTTKGNYLGTSDTATLNFKTNGMPAGHITSMQHWNINKGLSVDASSSNNGSLFQGLTFGGRQKEGFLSIQNPAGLTSLTKQELNGLDFITNGTTRMSICNNGHVGIGTHKPLTRLLSVGDSNYVTIDSTGHAFFIAGTMANPSICLNNRATGLFQNNIDEIDLAVNGQTAFMLNVLGNNIKIGCDGATMKAQLPPVGYDRDNVIIGNSTLDGSNNAILSPGGNSTIASSVKGYGNLLVGGNAVIQSNNAMVLGQMNTLLNSNAVGGGEYIVGAHDYINNASCCEAEFIFGSKDSIISTHGWNYIIGNQVTLKNSTGCALLVPSRDGQGGLQQVFSGYTNAFVGVFIGGYNLYTNMNHSMGLAIAPGGGSWASISDKAQKESFQVISTQEILNKFCALPITQWSYKSQAPDPEGRLNTYKEAPLHIGPMAQDFNAAFGFGEFKDRITDMDLMGVLGASIQALQKEVMQLQEELHNLKQTK